MVMRQFDVQMMYRIRVVDQAEHRLGEHSVGVQPTARAPRRREGVRIVDGPWPSSGDGEREGYRGGRRQAAAMVSTNASLEASAKEREKTSRNRVSVAVTLAPLALARLARARRDR